MNVLLVTADTLRADHLDCYGYWRSTAPNLKQLAEEGVRFETFIGQCAHTLPSFTSMMTGRTPFETGVVATLHCVPDTPSGRLSDRTPVLAEWLAAGGVHTYAVDNLVTFACHPSWFIRGFGEYLNPNPESFVTQVTAEGVNGVLLPLLDRLREPFFLWVHYWDPHLPYNQPDNYLAPFPADDGDAHVYTSSDGRRYIPRWGAVDTLNTPGWAGGAIEHRSGDRVAGARNMINAYDGEILFLDTCLGRVFDKLVERGLYDDTCIFFTADHGETMVDHLTHFTHVEPLDACTRIPLIVKPAEDLGVRPRVVPEPATHTDLVPTILDLFGVTPPTELSGFSLRELLTGGTAGRRDHVVSTGMQILDSGLWKSIEVSVRTREWRLVRKAPLKDYPTDGLKLSRLWEIIARLYESEPELALYHTSADPDEYDNLAALRPDVVEGLQPFLQPALESPYFYRSK